MFEIRTFLSIMALSLAVNAAPAEIAVRQGPQPGQSVTNLKFFPSNDLTCDAGGAPYQKKAVFVPQAGTTQTFVVGQCYPQGPYGSIGVDFLAGGCKFEEHSASDCSDAGTTFTTAGCHPGPPIFPNYWRVVC